jgi:hypothetical protein
MDQLQIRNQLASLLVDNADFEALERKFGVYCPFDALGVADWEPKHSQFLANILDPQRPHGFGSRVLQAFLTASTRSSDGAALSTGLSPLDVHLMDPGRCGGSAGMAGARYCDQLRGAQAHHCY